MTRAVRQVAVVLGLLFAVLVVSLQLIAVVQAEDLADAPTNDRRLVERYASQRGPIRLGEQEAARSVPTADGDRLAFRREYPLDGDRAAHVVGWDAVDLRRSGIEAAYDDVLSATSSGLLADELAVLLGQRRATGSAVQLTLDPAAQAAAERALAARDGTGAVVAIEPRTGAVLAHASSPGFDADRLATHDRQAALDAWDELRDDPARPLLDRAVAERFPPGSTFKLVVAAAALEAGTDPDTAYPDEPTYAPGVGEPIGNATPGPCADGESITLRRALVVSCNTTFAQVGVDLGDDAVRRQAQAFGFDQAVPYDLPVAESVFPKDTDDAQLAQSSIGQFDVRATPMQMAVMTAAIADGGVLRRPYVVAEVRDTTDRLLQGPRTGPWEPPGFTAQAISARTADQLGEMMVEVVQDGTGTRAAIPGVRVGGKTGTAQDPSDDTATAWFVGFAEDRVAVAVVLPDAGGEGGGQAAAPIARAVMEAALGAGG